MSYPARSSSQRQRAICASLVHETMINQRPVQTSDCRRRVSAPLASPGDISNHNKKGERMTPVGALRRRKAGHDAASSHRCNEITGKVRTRKTDRGSAEERSESHSQTLSDVRSDVSGCGGDGQWADTSWSDNERAWCGGSASNDVCDESQTEYATQLRNAKRMQFPLATYHHPFTVSWPTTFRRPSSSRSTPALPWLSWLCASLVVLTLIPSVAESRTILNAGNPDAKRLYDDLLSNYNKLVRPVVNTTDPLTVRIKLKLSQLIDVNLKNQIMTTNLWVEQFWFDYKLVWDPSEYGGVQQLHVPSDHIWRPDIVLYNNADGNFEVTLATKATLSYNGLVEWKPPAIYKSSCEIDVEYFPFDEQTCVMKFGSWTYDGSKVDLRHWCEVEGTNIVPLGIDLSEFYMSVEWDILEVPAVRNEKFYTCCDEPYLDITFNITMRRKTLFYTVNLIIPCMGISFLTVLTFYLPSDSGEKVTLSISILTSLYVFFLLVVEIIPPTSLVVPLLGKYLIFAMILVSISICVTVVVLNVHFRSPQTHNMAPWVKRVFIHILPRLLIMKRPQFQADKHTSLRKVMLRTCMGNEGSQSKDYHHHPHSRGHHRGHRGHRGANGGRATSSFIPPEKSAAIFDNGDIFRPKSEELREAFSEVFPEDIPGLPRHRPGLYSPRLSLDGDMYYPGCKLHGHGHDLDSDEAAALNPAGGGHVSVGMDDRSSTCSSPLPPMSASAIPPYDHSNCSEQLHKACACVNFIAEHTKAREEATKVKEDWKYVAMVLDRLFLWIFTLAVCVGTAGIILQAPSLYDDRVPIDREISDIGIEPHRTRKKEKIRSLSSC